MKHKRDEQLLNEAYNEIFRKLNTEKVTKVDESFLDVGKAAFANIKGTIKGAGKSLSGQVQNLKGQAYDKVGRLAGSIAKGAEGDNTFIQKGKELKATGEENKQLGREQGPNAKRDAYLKSAPQTTIKDIKLLGFDIDDAEGLEIELHDLLAKYLAPLKTRRTTTAGPIPKNLPPRKMKTPAQREARNTRDRAKRAAARPII